MKSMKRNTKKLAVIGLLIGCLTIGSVSVFALTNGNPYQDFKNAALLTVQEQNMTVAADVNVRQDGVTILSGDTVVQLNSDDQYSNSHFQIGGETLDMESCQTDETEITRIGDKYTSNIGKENDGEENDGEDGFDFSPGTLKLAEMVVDGLVGDVKTHFAGNGNTISVNLEGAQIPELLNVAASAGIEKAAGKNREPSPEKELLGNVLDNLSITKDVQVKRVGMEAQLKDGYIDTVSVNLTLTGKDNNGISHEIEIICNAAISNIGSTNPNTIDTEGKDVTEITSRHH